ncbi:hypothetical protein EVA_14676 [gut metagenome]|uniref:Uncharacterized protein n=1 Tax=gut metagenome TaxID=749906 RepID=J9FRU5_9ZZZZ
MLFLSVDGTPLLLITNKSTSFIGATPSTKLQFLYCFDS